MHKYDLCSVPVQEIAERWVKGGEGFAVCWDCGCGISPMYIYLYLFASLVYFYSAVRLSEETENRCSCGTTFSYDASLFMVSFP